MFLATTADGKTAVSWGEGQKTKKTHPDWVGPCALVDSKEVRRIPGTYFGYLNAVLPLYR